MSSVNSIFFFIFLIFINQFVSAKPNIFNPGDELNSLDPNSTLTSIGRHFTLGFFTIPSTNLTYLGIWVTNSIPIRRVWVAHRDKPMTTNGVLIIDKSGNLVIIHGAGGGDNTILFNISKEESSGNTTAILDDTGNFKLYDLGTENRTLWQSFHHPTDTLLPEMKLGYDFTRKQNWTLTSWLSDQIPASGAFTMRLEQNQSLKQVVIYRRGKIHWSDELNVLQLRDNIGSGSFVSDATGMNFSFHQSHDNKAISMLQLSSMGELIDSEYKAVTPSLCYGYGGNIDGCVSSGLSNCRGRNDSFKSEHGNWEGEFIQYDDSLNIGLSDCMERCWNDCKCKGFNTSDNGTGCWTWGKNAVLHLLDKSSGKEIGVLSSHKPPKKKTWIWIIVSVAAVLTSALTVYLCYGRIQRRKLKEAEKKVKDDYAYQLTGSNSFNYGDELVKDITDAPDVKIFSLAAILAATNNFSNDNKLGHGGYGPVYKGKLFDGREIAVKRLSKTSLQGFEQFKSELILISKLQHTNLVRLYGCCINREEKMLIYEFMPNKSLDFFLYVKDKKKRIDWQMRFNIIEGVGQGLLYLHKYSRMRVIHRDLKASNVLLDENMHPKIADFGIARIFQHNMTEATTNRVVGTYGYMAPEYAMEGTFSIKSDVFSFGVLILEIVSGKRNSSFYNLDRPLNLVGYAWELWKGKAALELKDEALGESCDVKQLLKTIHVGLLCVQENANDRPTMSEVIFMLSNEIADIPNPKQPSFFTGRQPVEVKTKSTDFTFDKSIQVSVNGLTLSTEAR